MPKSKVSSKCQKGWQVNIESFPNFDKSGSILGMKKKYYGKDALLVRCGS